MAKKLKFNGFDKEKHPFPDRYRGVTGEWKAGETKEGIDDKEAERLLKDFPGVFETTK